MRFAYIDSQGHEVPIPGVDALALRIELGAIGPETQLYDAQADRWGPARTHEIFVTLARESEEEGYVAPPPPVTPPAPGAEDADTDGNGGSAEAGSSGPPAAGAESDASEAPSAGDGGLGFELTLTGEDEPLTPQPPEEPAPQDVGGEDAPLSFDLADELSSVEASGADPGPEEAGGEPDPADPFTAAFGDEPPETAGDAPLDFGLETGTSEASDEDRDVAPGHGMELEPPLSGQQDSEEPVDASGGLELERPMSEFSEDSPPAWMEQEGPGYGGGEEDGGLADFSLPDDEPEDQEVVPPEPAGTGSRVPPASTRTPRARPSPPRRPPRRSLAGPLMGILALLVVGAGGWFGWRALQGGPAEPPPPDFPEVTLPEIPAELLPTMRDVGEEALAGTVEEMRAMAGEADLAAQPRQDWLSGVYLANASDYADVAAYWEGIEAFVARVRDADAALFHQEYEEVLAAREITGDTAALLLERADSGFLATRPERHLAYEQMGDLVDASLALHDFLVANEARIDYDPAAGGMSADPVLEAVPATPELGEEMWDRVDEITGALDRLGTLDRVTTERLTAVLFDRIRQAGFR